MNKTWIWIVVVVVLVGGGVAAVVVMQKKPTQVISPVVPAVTPQVVSPTPAATQKVSLTISTPKDGATVNTNKVTVRGVTVVGAEVAVNDQDVTADATGNFSATVTLDDGENTITVVAVDGEGNSAEQELTVKLLAE